MDVSVFIDESGTIAKGICSNKSYFIIAMVFTSNTKFVGSVFKRERLKIVKKKEHLSDKLKTEKEIKGSDISETDKTNIYTKLAEKCFECMEIGFIVLNNQLSSEIFRSVTPRTFNYLINLYMQNSFNLKSKFKECEKLNFIIDEQNIATKTRYTLEEYLNTELVVGKNICPNGIETKYVDSKSSLVLQLTDFLANTCYRSVVKNNPDAFKNIELLNDLICNKKYFRFPL